MKCMASKPLLSLLKFFLTSTLARGGRKSHSSATRLATTPVGSSLITAAAGYCLIVANCW